MLFGRLLKTFVPLYVSEANTFLPLPGPASISKPTASSTSPGTTSTGSSGGLFSTKSPTQQTGSTPAVAESKPETEVGSAEAADPEVGASASGASGTTPEPVGQPIESLSRPRIDRGPRLTRTPIVWGQPTGSSSASQPGSAAGTQATTAPTVPQLRGRGVARARRSVYLSYSRVRNKHSPTLTIFDFFPGATVLFRTP